MALLDSMSSSRKRSRSPFDEGRDGMKAARSNAGTPMFSRSPSGVVSAGDSPTGIVDFGPPPSRSVSVDDVVIPDAVDDPMIYGMSVFPRRFSPVLNSRSAVSGVPMPLSQVTEEMGEDMTPEEYQIWYELLVARSG